MDTPTFAELGLTPELLKAVDRLGFETSSPIQAATIPVALEGRDIVGLSETGSGKTAAFTLPTLQQIDLKKRVTQAIILCPTRELCVQVCEEVNRLACGLKGFHAIPVYGGAPIDRQIRYLRDGVQVVVGTPGRVLDHLDRGTLDLDNVRIAILDEADRMLDMGFREDMESILGACPPVRQNLFFSATMNRGVERLIENFSENPETISIKRKTVTVDSVEQSVYEVRNRSKIEVVSRLLDMDPPRLAIIFCNTKRAVDDCCDALINRGYAADRIHGDITQGGRERVLKNFRSGKVELLVATDVAARGLDIDEVDAVFNYDLPQDPEDYVHRIGRTGRAGRSGKAYSFVFGKDRYRLRSIERYIKQNITRARVPSLEDLEGLRSNILFEALKDRLESGKFETYQDFTDRLFDQGYTATDIISALFSTLKDGQQRENESISEDKEPPRSKRPYPREDRDQSYGGKSKRKFSKDDRPDFDKKPSKKKFSKKYSDSDEGFKKPLKASDDAPSYHERRQKPDSKEERFEKPSKKAGKKGPKVRDRDKKRKGKPKWSKERKRAAKEKRDQEK